MCYVHSSQSNVYSVRCTNSSISAVCSAVHSAQCVAQCNLHSVQCIVCRAQCKVCTMCSVINVCTVCTMNSVCTVQSAKCVCSAQCTVCTVCSAKYMLFILSGWVGWAAPVQPRAGKTHENYMITLDFQN